MALQEEPSMGIKCIKYLLCLSNFLFVITAILIISVGSTIYAIYNDFDYFYEQRYFSPAVLLISIGFLILVVSLFGFIGALKESTAMIMTFSLMLGLILIVEIVAVIMAFTTPKSVEVFITNNLEYSMKHYGQGSEDTKEVDFLQQALNCCGVNGPEDWYKINTVGIPESCCINPYNITSEKHLFTTPDNHCEFHQAGCADRLIDLVYESVSLIGSGALSIAFVQGLGMVFSFMLGMSIRRAKTEREMQRIAIRENFLNTDYYTQMGVTQDGVKTPVTYAQEKEIDNK